MVGDYHKKRKNRSVSLLLVERLHKLLKFFLNMAHALEFLSQQDTPSSKKVFLLFSILTKVLKYILDFLVEAARFAIHHLLAQCFRSDAQHLLDAPEEHHVRALVRR